MNRIGRKYHTPSKRKKTVSHGKRKGAQHGRKTVLKTVRMTGAFTANKNGTGFVTVEGEAQDILIPAEYTLDAFHKDTVEIELLPRHGKRKEGKVVRALDRGYTEIVGTFLDFRTFGIMRPDDPRLYREIFLREHPDKVLDGDKIVVRMDDYGAPGRSPEGHIVELIGHAGEPGTDTLSILRAYGIPTEFPEHVLAEAETMPASIGEEEITSRRDLREIMTITIDGEDAKDLDDAVSLSMEGENYLLGVHIADVSEYVKEHSSLDMEARARGTSVYLPDRVVPMLPKRLSNGICSLNGGEDRLTLSCLMTIDPKGKVIDHEITESVICTARRMSYTEVQKLLDGADPALEKECAKLLPMIRRMEELARILRRRREDRGAIDFDLPEKKIVLDELGYPIKIGPYERNEATRIIEDFMLAANETVAEDCFKRELPIVYRTHEEPDPEKLAKLSAFVQNFGFTLRLKGGEVTPKEIQALLRRTEGSPEEFMIARMTLRSMMQAKYTEECTGHFGLAAQYYCHFTSPIRRYPDLCVHRILKERLHGKFNTTRRTHYEKLLPEIARHSSATERRAVEAEREADKLKEVQYMETRIGEIFDGVISSVTGWGFYVELPNTIEGMVPVASLRGEYYHFHEESCELIGERTGTRYRIGQPVRIRVDRADRLLRQIDFAVVTE